MPKRTARVTLPGNMARDPATVTKNVNGHIYELPPGKNSLDVPLADAFVLSGSGFVIEGLVGPSSERPGPGDLDWPMHGYGYRFFDTTERAWMQFDVGQGVWSVTSVDLSPPPPAETVEPAGEAAAPAQSTTTTTTPAPEA